MTNMTGPAVYGAAFDAYWEAGWRGVLPLPPRQKKPVPRNTTGRDAQDPSYSDVYEWAEQYPDGNIALRLPPNVIGIDVDHYDGKDGGGTLDGLVAQYGPLPPTWTTGSRGDGVSGIRLYRVPEGLRWPGDLGGGIEVIQARHRYAIVWPSVHPKGGTYTWTHPALRPAPTDAASVPTVAELPDLPQAWVDGLTGGLAEQNIQAADLDLAEAAKWINTHGQGGECRLTERAAAGYIQELATGARSRHEVIKDATMNLCHLAAEGHRGSRSAIGRVRTAFLDAMRGDSREADAPAEWDRLILGALRIAAADTVEEGDPCDNPLHGLMATAPASPTHLLGPAPVAPPAAPAPAPAAPAAAPVDDWTGEGLQGLLVAASAAEVAAQPEEDRGPVPSWTPVDLAGFLDGSYKPEEATMFVRTDGVGLIYPGLVHDFHGESESGKSLVAQAICAGLIMDGQEVVYLDFESGPGPMAQRMLSFGLTPDQVMEKFIYVRPELNPYALTETEAFKALLSRRPALVILDGVTDALVQFGAGSDSNDEITKWHRYVPRTIADRTKAAIILIDHVVKSSESRGRFAIGGQAKLATIDGASYAVEITEPIGKGMRGLIVLRVGKDRPGTIRPECGAWRASDRSQEAVRVVIDSSRDPGRIRWEFLPPESSVNDAPVDPAERRRRYLGGAMERASRVIEERGRMRRADLKAYLISRFDTDARVAEDAVAALIVDGFLGFDRGHVELTNVYRQPGDPDLGLDGLLVSREVETVDDSYGRATGPGVPML
jgi:hypothetical protein